MRVKTGRWPFVKSNSVSWRKNISLFSRTNAEFSCLFYKTFCAGNSCCNKLVCQQFNTHLY